MGQPSVRALQCLVEYKANVSNHCRQTSCLCTCEASSQPVSQDKARRCHNIVLSTLLSPSPGMCVCTVAGDDLFKLLHDIIEKYEDPVECLEKMIRAHMVDWCLKRKKESKIIVMDDAWLTRERRRTNIESQRKLYSLYKERLSELQKKDLIIDTDITVLCFSIFGIIAQSIRWFDERGPLTKEDVAQNVINILFNGILRIKNKCI